MKTLGTSLLATDAPFYLARPWKSSHVTRIVDAIAVDSNALQAPSQRVIESSRPGVQQLFSHTERHRVHGMLSNLRMGIQNFIRDETHSLS
jgi:hypothetical protein